MTGVQTCALPILQGDGLPFADALTAEQMQQAFDDEGISFGEDDRELNVSSANDTLVIDGTTCSMPGTELNQAEDPQPRSQTDGLGFPILRAVALTSLATGMLVALAMGRYAGKETGETALFRTLLLTAVENGGAGRLNLVALGC